MPLSKEHVKQLAHLARLELTLAEVEKRSLELPSIIAYFDQIRDIPIEAVEPLDSISGSPGVFRPDEISPSLSREQTLGNAPARDDEFFLVPKVVDR